MSPSYGNVRAYINACGSRRLKNEKKYYFYRTHVVSKIRQCCAYKTKNFMSSVHVVFEGVAKINLCIGGVNAVELQGSFKNRVCHEM